MSTPIADFLKKYADSDTARFHMPGHKGRGATGLEKYDITEIYGADFLYAPTGIITKSEATAAALFGSKKTCFSTEGSSQCIRAMLHLCFTQREKGALPLVVASRNAHKAFIYAAAVIGFDIEWLYPEETNSLCRCKISAENLENVLAKLPAPPCAVYVTGVDYLGGTADIASLSKVCHKYKTPLVVDNAHGAYLHFLPKPAHPLDLGADMCCDSAHKTLPALTGCAYLHISKNAPDVFSENAKSAMELFGSTSPSYLLMASLDLCNEYILGDYREKLLYCTDSIKKAKQKLAENGWQVEESDPLRITLKAPNTLTCTEIAQNLRKHGIECEYADRQYIVFMATPENSQSDFDRLVSALGENKLGTSPDEKITLSRAEKAMTVREALFSPKETVSVADALGRICASPTVSCPPAIPIAVSGERIDENAIRLFEYYGIKEIEVVAR